MKTSEGFHVVYLTGPPAVGKSTLVAALRKRVAPLEVFIYSERLLDFVRRTRHLPPDIQQDDLRRLSSSLIGSRDVDAVDDELLRLVDSRRATTHVVIDSHAVTKESYGFRVTPFSLSKLARIRPTIICMLYTEPEVVIERIGRNPQGRPQISTFEAGLHNGLQASVALIYGINLGVPVYFLESSKSPEVLVEELVARMNLPEG